MEIYDEKEKKESYVEEDSPDEGFMQGFEQDEEVEECEECGAAIIPDKKVVKMIDDEEHIFCSEICAKEFEEGLE